MHHPYGIVGLALNMFGSALLLWFPPKVAEYTSNGLYIPDGGTFGELPVSEEGRSMNKRRYQVRRDGFHFAFGLLFLGFLLQLLDLLMG